MVLLLFYSSCVQPWHPQPLPSCPEEEKMLPRINGRRAALIFHQAPKCTHCPSVTSINLLIEKNLTPEQLTFRLALLCPSLNTPYSACLLPDPCLNAGQEEEAPAAQSVPTPTLICVWSGPCSALLSSVYTVGWAWRLPQVKVIGIASRVDYSELHGASIRRLCCAEGRIQHPTARLGTREEGTGVLRAYCESGSKKGHWAQWVKVVENILWFSYTPPST